MVYLARLKNLSADTFGKTGCLRDLGELVKPKKGELVELIKLA